MSPSDPESFAEAIASPRWTCPRPRRPRPRVRRPLGSVAPPRDARARAGRRAGALRAGGLDRSDGRAPVRADRARRAGPAARAGAVRPRRRRDPGVHLHWAMPDALLRGTLATAPDGATNRLAPPALPDRWLVLRVLVPKGAADAAVRGWVICADTGTSSTSPRGRRSRPSAGEAAHGPARRADRQRRRLAAVGVHLRRRRRPLRLPRPARRPRADRAGRRRGRPGRLPVCGLVVAPGASTRSTPRAPTPACTTTSTASAGSSRPPPETRSRASRRARSTRSSGRRWDS